MDRGWSRREVAGGLGVAGLLAGCASGRRDPGTLVAGLTYDVDTLNVYATGFLGDVQAAVVEGLVAPDAQARYVPVLATAVPTLANGLVRVTPAGGMTVTYPLRRRVRWHDGAPFTSADVRFTWEAVNNPAFIAESKDGADRIVAVDTPDPFTAICHYPRVDPGFAATLFTFGILPRHRLAGHDLNNDPYNERPIGTGPFRVDAFRRGQYVLTTRNPFYWRRDGAGRSLPSIRRLIFRIVPNSNTLITQLRSGELDLCCQTPFDQAKQMGDLGGVELIRSPLLSWQHLDFNFRHPLLRQRPLRRAIAHAIDRNALSRANGGFNRPLETPVVPILPFHDGKAPRYAYDPARAERLLDTAGYPRGADGVRVGPGGRLSFRFLTQSGKGDDELAQQVLIAQLAAIGVEALADNKQGIAFRQARYKGDYDLLYGSWVTGVDPIYSRIFGTGGALNSNGYSNPVLDRVLRSMEASLDPAEQKRAALAMQRILGEDVPGLPLTSGTAVVSKTRRLHGFVPNPTNMTPFVSCAGWRLA